MVKKYLAIRRHKYAQLYKPLKTTAQNLTKHSKTYYSSYKNIDAELTHGNHLPPEQDCKERINPLHL